MCTNVRPCKKSRVNACPCECMSVWTNIRDLSKSWLRFALRKLASRVIRMNWKCVRASELPTFVFSITSAIICVCTEYWLEVYFSNCMTIKTYLSTIFKLLCHYLSILVPTEESLCILLSSPGLWPISQAHLGLQTSSTFSREIWQPFLTIYLLFLCLLFWDSKVFSQPEG